MTRVVLDASVALGLALPDERVDPLTARRWQDAELHAPSLFAYEIANGLTTAVRRNRLSAAQATRVANAIAALGIRLAPAPPAGELLPMAVSADLSAYDAAYLRLAGDLGAALATRDGPLAAAARTAGVAVITSR